MTPLPVVASRDTVAPFSKAGTDRLIHAASFAAMLACSTAAFAQQPPGKGDPEGSSWGLGLAGISAQKVYKGMDSETKALPMVSYENQYVKIGGPNLELKLPGIELNESQRLGFGIVTKLFDGAGYEASDSSALAGMAERKSSVWLGGKMEWENDLADVKLEWLGDASGKSKGQRFALGLERKLMLSESLMLIPQVGIEWVDKKYVDYYYGVRPGEAMVGRAAYTGKATVNPEISLTGIYRFDTRHSMMLNVGVTSLGKEIKDSPIVDRSTESRVMLGYKYSF
ncbi:MAG: MipA/OmpV family protein [Propionivibrio sp.]